MVGLALVMIDNGKQKDGEIRLWRNKCSYMGLKQGPITLDDWSCWLGLMGTELQHLMGRKLATLM